jgi:hypothetical protein
MSSDIMRSLSEQGAAEGPRPMKHLNNLASEIANHPQFLTKNSKSLLKEVTKRLKRERKQAKKERSRNR